MRNNLTNNEVRAFVERREPFKTKQGSIFAYEYFDSDVETPKPCAAAAR